MGGRPRRGDRRKLDYQLAYGSPAVFRNARFVRISDTAGELIDNRRGDPELLCTPSAAVEAILAYSDNMSGQADRDWSAGLRRKHEERVKAAAAEPLATGPDGLIHPARIFSVIAAQAAPYAIGIADGGDILSFARIGLTTSTYLDSGTFGCLGVGVPYANAASLAFPGRQVIAVIGDGSFGFNAMEIDTAVRHGATPVFIIANNAAWNIEGCIMSNRYFHTFGRWYLPRGGALTMYDGVERLYNPLPLHHANCLSISAPAMLISGGCLVFPDRFHPRCWWQDLVACDITAVQMQGIIPNLLLKLDPVPEEHQHRVRFGLCAGIEPAQHAAFEDRYGFPVVEMWAMSETGRMLTDHEEPRSIHDRPFGRSVPGLDAQIIDDEGRILPANSSGELVIRHTEADPRGGFFSGYLKDEAAMEEAWRGGWFHTGDTAICDESGMFHFLDRKKNIIRRDGENIAAAEVEACLCAHVHVKQAAVIAVADEIREEEVFACIVLQDSAQSESEENMARLLFEWCRTQMAYFKAPAWVMFMQSLPIGTSQKLQKIALFPKDVDPREQAGVVDLRAIKRPANSGH